MSRVFSTRVAAALIVLAALLSASAAPSQGQRCDSPPRRADLDFTLRDLDGREFNLSKERGKVILLDFWATWCAPCRVEMPGLIELQAKYRGRGFVVLGVSVDESLAPVQRFTRQLGVNYPILQGAGREDLQKAFSPLVGFPTAFVITRDGAICRQHTGLTPKDVFEAEIRPLL